MIEEIEKRKVIYYKYDGHCAYCGREISLEDFQIEHVIPRKKEGTNDKSNLVPSCRKCNIAKGVKSVNDFKNYILDIRDARFETNTIKKYRIEYAGLIDMLKDDKFYYEKNEEKVYVPISKIAKPKTYAQQRSDINSEAHRMLDDEAKQFFYYGAKVTFGDFFFRYFQDGLLEIDADEFGVVIPGKHLSRIFIDRCYIVFSTRTKCFRFNDRYGINSQDLNKYISFVKEKQPWVEILDKRDFRSFFEDANKLSSEIDKEKVNGE